MSTNFFSKLEEKYPIFKTLSEREKYLLRNMYTKDLTPEEETMIKECHILSLKKQPLLIKDESTLKTINEIKIKYLNDVLSECEALPKPSTPEINLIIGPPGSGKSKAINKNEYVAFYADADYIKKLIAIGTDTNINSPLIHSISSEIRDLAYATAAELGCNITIEKVGDKLNSILNLINKTKAITNKDYNYNLHCVHCREDISRKRNAARFIKYNTNANISARMLSDDAIQNMGVKHLENFYTILQDENYKKLFNVKNAFICESMFEPNKIISLTELTNDNSKNLNKIFYEVKSLITSRVKQTLHNEQNSAETLTHNILLDIYDTTTVENINRLSRVESLDVDYINQTTNLLLQNAVSNNTETETRKKFKK